MRKNARIILAALLAAGVWLALKSPTRSRRVVFLPAAWSQYLDLMDFWFNLAAFAMLGATAWLAFGSMEKMGRRAFEVTVFVTLLNVLLELMQTSIPGRSVDMADVWAGLIGCLLGIAGGLAAQIVMSGKKSDGRRPRVLFLDQTGHLGGAELMLLDIAAARAADSEAVLFQDGEFRTALEAAGVKTRVFTLGDEAAAVNKQAGLPHMLRCVPALTGMLLRTAHAARSFDVVYANTAKALIIGGPAARMAGRRVIFHLHDIIADGHFSMLNQIALVFFANTCASTVIANSEATRLAFITAGGRADLCVVIPNGFKTAMAKTDSDEIKALGAGMNIPADAWTVLMAGRLAPWKGQHVLLEALKSLPQAHAVLLGDALFTDEDREYARRLHEMADQPELRSRVHFAGFQSQTQPYFDLADVVVHASVYPEPFGRVIVEGMLAGKPVVASRAGGAAEIVQHEHTGLLVEPDDARRLAAALMRLKNDPAFASELASNAARTAHDIYDLDSVQAKIEAVIQRTASRMTDPAAEATQALGQTA